MTFSGTHVHTVHTGSYALKFKFPRCSCKLSFLFLPRRQSTLESLLAGYSLLWIIEEHKLLNNFSENYWSIYLNK